AGLAVARRAVDIEALLSPRQHLCRYREGHQIAIVTANLAGIEIGISVQMVTRYRSRDERPLRALVGVEVALPQWTVVRLVLHVFATSRQHQQGHCQQEVGCGIADPAHRHRLDPRLWPPINVAPPQSTPASGSP